MFWWSEEEDEKREGRRGSWFSVNTTFLYCSTDQLLMYCCMMGQSHSATLDSLRDRAWSCDDWDKNWEVRRDCGNMGICENMLSYMPWLCVASVPHKLIFLRQGSRTPCFSPPFQQRESQKKSHILKYISVRAIQYFCCSEYNLMCEFLNKTNKLRQKKWLNKTSYFNTCKIIKPGKLLGCVLH